MRLTRVEEGWIVVSTAGRDEGRTFVVLRPEGDQYAYIADGGLRGADRPKRKKLKHLKDTGKRAARPQGSVWTDAYLRGALSDIRPEKEG